MLLLQHWIQWRCLPRHLCFSKSNSNYCKQHCDGMKNSHSNDDVFIENKIFPKNLCSFYIDCLIQDNYYQRQLQSISDYIEFSPAIKWFVKTLKESTDDPNQVLFPWVFLFICVSFILYLCCNRWLRPYTAVIAWVQHWCFGVFI